MLSWGGWDFSLSGPDSSPFKEGQENTLHSTGTTGESICSLWGPFAECGTLLSSQGEKVVVGDGGEWWSQAALWHQQQST